MRACLPQVEKRNRLKLLNPSLEHLVSEGSTDPAVDDALASRTGRKRAHMGTSAKLGTRAMVWTSHATALSLGQADCLCVTASGV